MHLIKEKERASSLPIASGAGDLKASLESSLAIVGNMLPERTNNEEVGSTIRQLDGLLAALIERLESNGKELEAFEFSGIHDLGVPLLKFRSRIGTHRKRYAGRLDLAGQQCLERIFDSARHLHEIIEAWRRLSHLANLSLKRELVDLSKIVRACASEFMQDLPQRRLEFTIQPGVRTIGDATLLEIALSNLLANAVKFSRERDYTYIKFGTCDRNGETTCFLRDNGAGFDMAGSERMFRPFQRLHDRAEFPGKGLGLTTVRSIVNRHGGRVCAEGEVDKGATIYLTLWPCLT